MAACFVNAHSIMDTPHFSGEAVHGARNRNDLNLCSELKDTVLYEISLG